MISICIPVYNFNISSLINELTKQIDVFSLTCEILVIDDYSKNFKEINKKTCEKIFYKELKENIGRAKIRNLFLEYASFNYLLFLDCDSIVTTPTFLTNYVEAIKQNPYVVCGGRIYKSNKPDRKHLLRWKYGIVKESQSCAIRQKTPNRSFMTNNFLINKSILTQNKFDERIVDYGHEDTLFGYELKKKNIQITHIHNPVTNGDTELNKDYLDKTTEGIINLTNILKITNFDPLLIDDINILRFHHQLGKKKKIVNLLFWVFKPIITYLLYKGYISLHLFDFYKLGILIENEKKEGLDS